jgi:hypothetical protein
MSFRKHHYIILGSTHKSTVRSGLVSFYAMADGILHELADELRSQEFSGGECEWL